MMFRVSMPLLGSSLKTDCRSVVRDFHVSLSAGRSIQDTLSFTGKDHKARKKAQTNRNRNFINASSRKNVTVEALRRALELGAQVNAKDKYGSTALHWAVGQNRLDLVEFLVKEANADIDSKDNQGNTPLHQAALYGLYDVVNWLIENNATVNALNHRFKTPYSLSRHPNVSLTLFLKGGTLYSQDPDFDSLIALALKNDNSLLLKSLSERGYRLPLSVPTEQGPQPLFVWLARNQRLATLGLLIEQGQALDQQDSRGMTALHYAAEKQNPAMIERLLRQMARADLLNHQNKTAFDLALDSQRADVVLAFAPLKQHFSPLQQAFFDFYHLLEESRKPESDIFPSFLNQGSLNHLFTQWAWSQPEGKISPLLAEIIKANDYYYASHQGKARGWHPLESELLLLLCQPHTEYFLSTLSQAITSIYSFLYQHKLESVSPQVLQSWQRIGLLSHRFLAWKYDAMGGRDSLFAKYGCHLLRHPKEHQQYGDKSFIKRFVFKDKENQVMEGLVVFRRGYVLITNPEQGTLIIRNSSPAFGKGLMPHAAYYSPNAILTDEEWKDPKKINTDSALSLLDPPTDARFKSALDPSWYQETKFPDFLSHLETLTQGLMAAKQEYAKWKFDRTAFVEGKDFVGHQREGFKALLHFLEVLDQDIRFSKEMGIRAPVMPDLAFISPTLPPFFPFSYTDHQGKTQFSFPLTPQHLHELQVFEQEGGWVSPDSDLRRFLQMGLHQWGELILLEPHEQSVSTA